MLRISEGFDEAGSVQPHLIVGLLVAWVLVFLCLMKGVKSVGKVRHIIYCHVHTVNFGILNTDILTTIEAEVFMILNSLFWKHKLNYFKLYYI